MRFRAVEDRLLETVGSDGDGGKLGVVTGRVGSVENLLKWIGAGLAASALTAAAAIFAAGQKSGAAERDVEFLRAEVAAMRAELRDLVRQRYGRRHLPDPAPAATGDMP